MTDEHRLEEILSRIENGIAERENWQREHALICKPEQINLWLKITFALTGTLWFLVVAAGGYVWTRTDANTAILSERGERISRIEEKFLVILSKVDSLLALQDRQTAAIETLSARLWRHEIEQAGKRKGE